MVCWQHAFFKRVLPLIVLTVCLILKFYITEYMKNLILCALPLLLATGCSNKERTLSMEQVYVSQRCFKDMSHRTLVFNGINHVQKDPKTNYLDDDDEATFKRFRELGINCVRYGIHWDGLEPKPGKINEDYLKEIDKRVHWARVNDIYLILDMHQDLYSRKYGNGAPLWATLDEGLSHVEGEVWSDAYLMSPAVQKSFDNFWLNKPASDGVGIQDHYINVWQNVANRYADSVSVLGFDIMNEPFPGTSAQMITAQMMEGLMKSLSEKGEKIGSMEEMLAMWSDEQKRTELLSVLDDKDTFREILSNSSMVDSFEKNELSSFYQKIRDAIRQTQSRQILFFDHNYFCNMGVESTFRVPLMDNGRQDTLCAYAPHVYDLVVDTKAASKASHNRVDVMFETVGRSAENRNLPVLIGEWGAFYMGGKYRSVASHQTAQIEKLLAGHTYWAWWKNIEQSDYFDVSINRPYPQKVNGTLSSYRYNPKSRLFSCEWVESETSAPTRFYIPDLSGIEKGLKLVPMSDYKIIPIHGAASGYLEVVPCRQNRKLELSL